MGYPERSVFSGSVGASWAVASINVHSKGAVLAATIEVVAHGWRMGGLVIMEPERSASNQPGVSIVIVSEVRFLRESLAEILGHAPRMVICGQCTTLSDAIVATRSLQPGIVLLDVAFPDGLSRVAQFSAAGPGVNVVALALAETEENVLAWAKAGVAGYVPNTASIDELVSLIEQIDRGEQTCSSRIAGSLLRRIATAADVAEPASPVPATASLTRRELEVLGLLDAGLSNKVIARRLSISLGTTKSHVHNLLGKLSAQHRSEAMSRFDAARYSRIA